MRICNSSCFDILSIYNNHNSSIDGATTYILSSMKKRLSIRLIKLAITVLVLVGMLMPTIVSAGGFFETGSVTLTDSVDGGFWEQVTLKKMYVNPVVITSPISHNNSHSLFPRVRNVTSTTFEIGMQSPCESYNVYAGPNGADPSPEMDVCPPAAGWQDETVYYWVMEEGVWEFPTGEEVEAFAPSVTSVRSGLGADTIQQTPLMHTYANSAVIIFSAVNSFNSAEYTGAVATSDTAVGDQPAPTGGNNNFGLMLELMEFDTVHPAETVGWIAMLAGDGTNAGALWDVGITPGDDVDRHQDGCYTVGDYSVGADPDVISTQSTMNGGNGGLPRYCDSEVGVMNFEVHNEEDMVNDAERTGVPEVNNWFAFTKNSHGVLDFLIGEKTATEAGNDGVVAPGDTIVYDIAITNVLDDFDQPDSTSGPEIIDVLPNNVSFVSVSAGSDGTLTYNATTHSMEWNGNVNRTETKNMQFTVTVNSDACPGTEVRNQATILMDANGDGVNSIEELTDDPAADIEGDIDMDMETDDDDPTILELQCPRLTLVKDLINDGSGTATLTSFVLSATGTPTISGTSGSPAVTSTPMGVSSYSLSETTVPGYTASAWTCTDGTLVGNTLTLAADDDATCTITNDDNSAVDLKITKTVSDNEPQVGATVTFSIKVENLGPDTATNIDINDILPSGFTYVAGSIAGGTTQNDGSAPALAWTINSLAASAISTLTFVAIVNAP